MGPPESEAMAIEIHNALVNPPLKDLSAETTSVKVLLEAEAALPASGL